MQQLAQLDQAISGGTTAVIVVVYQDRLYVANVGDSRALLCKTDENGILKVGGGPAGVLTGSRDCGMT